MRARQQVMIPSMAKIILQACRPPKLSNFKIAEASSPPNAYMKTQGGAVSIGLLATTTLMLRAILTPANGAATTYSERRNASSLRRYHLER